MSTSKPNPKGVIMDKPKKTAKPKSKQKKVITPDMGVDQELIDVGKKALAKAAKKEKPKLLQKTEYASATVAGLEWMTESLAFNDGEEGILEYEGICYYTLAAALRIEQKFSAAGWRIPSINDFVAASRFFNGGAVFVMDVGLRGADEFDSKLNEVLKLNRKSYLYSCSDKEPVLCDMNSEGRYVTFCEPRCDNTISPEFAMAAAASKSRIRFYGTGRYSSFQMRLVRGTVDPKYKCDYSAFDKDK